MARFPQHEILDTAATDGQASTDAAPQHARSKGALAEIETDRLVPVRAYAYLFMAGGLLSYLTLLAPHELNQYDRQQFILATISLVAGIIAITKRHWFSSLTSQWLLTALGGVTITGGIVYSPTQSSASAFFYLWVSLISFYFFPLRAAIASLIFIAAAYGAALAYVNPPFDALEQWFVTVGTLGTIGPLVRFVKGRVDRLIAHLRDAAARDPLTGLLNRRGMADQIDLDAYERVSILKCDIDYFKQVNDSYGHAFGDQVLLELATILTASVKDIDGATCVRNGGEEFVVLVPDHSLEEAVKIAEAIRNLVERTFKSKGTDITLSIGVAQSPDHGTGNDLLKIADVALYAAKEFGRNRTVRFDENLRSIMPKMAVRRAAEREIHIATLATLAEVLDLRDAGTSNHSRTVGRYAEEMARELGMSEQQIDRVKIAGVLHDIGKIGIPDSILLKPSALTDEEFQRMKSHPAIGARILSAMDLTDIREWVLYHHERPDGRGYPRGLIGDEIPLGAAILAVADSYEAMTANRVYRKGMPAAVARAELIKGRASQFHPDVIDAFLRVLARADVTGGLTPLQEIGPIDAVDEEFEPPMAA